MATLYCGDALDVLKTLPEESVQTCVTSPPYWRQRDYGIPGQIGLELTPEEYTGRMVALTTTRKQLGRRWSRAVRRDWRRT